MTDWHNRAACKGLTHLFYPDVGQTGEQARAICAGCPVRTECAQDAIETGDPHGIRAGLSPTQRRTRRRTTPDTVIICDTCRYRFWAQPNTRLCDRCRKPASTARTRQRSVTV